MAVQGKGDTGGGVLSVLWFQGTENNSIRQISGISSAWGQEVPGREGLEWREVEWSSDVTRKRSSALGGH